jgi:outer membrane lipoprotein LolB
MCANGAFRNRSNRGTCLALLAALLLLAGCATRQATLLPEMPDWTTRSMVLGRASSWEFTGRIAVSAGDDGFNGKIRWIQDGDTFQATVGGPLGIGTVRIEGDGRAIVHTDKDGVRTELQDAEQELFYRYGWTIPVASLRYWALGLPDPSAVAQTELNSDQQLARLVQRNWTVQISRYRVSNGQSMPNLLSATSSQTRVRIVFDKWWFFD